MARRYMTVRLGSSRYYALVCEEYKGGVRIVDKRAVQINGENLSENGFDRDALKGLFEGQSVSEFMVILPHQDVVTGIVEFPLTDRKKIENALTYELENDVMDTPEELVYDYSLLNNAEGKTQLGYLSVKKERMRAILQEFSMIGMDPAYVVAHQNSYSGICGFVFDKDSQTGVKLIVDMTDGVLTLAFVDSSAFSFGRTLGIINPEEERDIVRNFITSTLQYYRIRAKREVLSTFIVSDDESVEYLYNLLQDVGISNVSRLALKDSIPQDIEPHFVLPFSASVSRIELTKRQLVNFRKGEFIYKGEYDYLKRQLIKYGVGVLIVVILAIMLTIYKFRMLSKYEEQLNNSLAEVTKQILGKPYDNFTTALAVIKGKTDPKNLSIPRTSAFDYFMYLSDSFPDGIDINIRTIEIGDKKIRLEGETDSFEAVDRIVGELKKNSCFKDIAKGKVKKSPDGKKIDFDLSITPSC